MISIHDAPILLLGVSILLVAVGGGSLIFSKKNLDARVLRWLLAGFFLVALLLGGWSWWLLSREGFEPAYWVTGWILRHNELGALSVGVVFDPTALVFLVLAVLVSLLCLVNPAVWKKEKSKKTALAATALSAGGVCVGWVSDTPWLGFFGILLTSFAGFAYLINQGDGDIESELAARFAWERIWGLFLCSVGTCFLAGSREPLLLASGTSSWSQPPESTFQDTLGASMLVIGLFLQFQPFPLLGWTLKKGNASRNREGQSFEFVLTRLFPAWTAFAFLFRLEGEFRGIGVFPGAGWAVLVCAVLTVLPGMFENHPKTNAGLWVSSGFLISFAALVFSGKAAGLQLMLGVSFSALALAFCSDLTSDQEEVKSVSRKKRFRVICFLALALSLGLPGLVSSGGFVSSLASCWESLAAAVLFWISIFLFFLLGVRLVLDFVRKKSTYDDSWLSFICPSLVLTMGLGVAWTGTLTGGFLENGQDRMVPSVIELMLGSARVSAQGGGGDYVFSAALTFGAAVLAGVLGLWLSSSVSRKCRWDQFAEDFPRSARFFSHGYGIDNLFSKVLFYVVHAGHWLGWLIEKRVWEEALPQVLVRGLNQSSEAVSKTDAFASQKISWALKKSVELPARGLQRIQNGDVQWYIFFAILAGVVLFAFFIRG